jgi:coenzyme Q-binding protein COQ10
MVVKVARSIRFWTQGCVMARWCDSRVLELPVEAAFDLVADVEAYPEFLPLWQRASIVARADDEYETEQTVGLGVLSQSFRTRTRLDRPRHISVTSSDCLFRALDLTWDFQPEGARHCRVHFVLECDVALWWLKPTIEQMMAATAQSMIEAFEARAQRLAAALPAAA